MPTNMQKLASIIKNAETIKISSYSGDLVALYNFLAGCKDLTKVDLYYNATRFKPVKRKIKTHYTLTLHPQYVDKANYHQKIWIVDNHTIIISTGNLNRDENINMNNLYIVIKNKLIVNDINLTKCNNIIVDLDKNIVRVSHQHLNKVVSKLLPKKNLYNGKVLSLGHSSHNSRLPYHTFRNFEYYTRIPRFYSNAEAKELRTNYTNEKNHAKAFLIQNERFGLFYIGSSNFTAGGWENNIEGGAVYYSCNSKHINKLINLFTRARGAKSSWTNCEIRKELDEESDDIETDSNQWQIEAKCINYALSCFGKKRVKKPQGYYFNLTSNNCEKIPDIDKVSNDKVLKKKLSEEEFLLLTVKNTAGGKILESHPIENPLFKYNSDSQSKLFIHDIYEERSNSTKQIKKKQKTNQALYENKSIDVRFNWNVLHKLKEQINDVSETNVEGSKISYLQKHKVLIENHVLKILKKAH